MRVGLTYCCNGECCNGECLIEDTERLTADQATSEAPSCNGECLIEDTERYKGELSLVEIAEMAMSQE